LLFWPISTNTSWVAVVRPNCICKNYGHSPWLPAFLFGSMYCVQNNPACDWQTSRYPKRFSSQRFNIRLFAKLAVITCIVSLIQIPSSTSWCYNKQSKFEVGRIDCSMKWSPLHCTISLTPSLS
jgi:hypothetical protein